MGKITGFMEYERQVSEASAPEERIRHYNEFHTPLAKDERRRQGARCMDCGVPFCQSGVMLAGMTSGCPLNNLIPEWNDLVYQDRMEQAASRLLKTNNFPEFTARVCPAPCEASCTCGLNGNPVTIKENEYAVIEEAFESGYLTAKPPRVRTGKKVAVIGSGPSGLAAADQLNKRGHLVTVFERSDRIGGLLMYGIPNMKLEKKIVDRRTEMMEQEGVTFVTGINVGKDKKSSKILDEFDAVILACGASNPRDIKAEGRDAKGIYFAVDYLKSATKYLMDFNLLDEEFPGRTDSGADVAKHKKAQDSKANSSGLIDAYGKNVVIVGGGDTGNDCVGTSIRQGAKSVVQIEMMPKPPEQRLESNPWPEWPKILKTDYGQEEAIALFGEDPRIYQSTIKEFVKDEDGNLKKVTCIRLEAKRDEASGRFMMQEVEGSEFTIDADMVLIAAGFLGAEDYVVKAFGVELDGRTNVKTEAGKYTTNVEKIFATGDMRRGQSLVVWAIQEGRQTAREVDAHLMGYTNLV